MFEKIVMGIDSDAERAARVIDTVQVLAQRFDADVMTVFVREVERPAAMVGVARPSALPPVLHVEFGGYSTADRRRCRQPATRGGAAGGRTAWAKCGRLDGT